jgi:hypothetical protein
MSLSVARGEDLRKSSVATRACIHDEKFENILLLLEAVTEKRDKRPATKCRAGSGGCNEHSNHRVEMRRCE